MSSARNLGQLADNEDAVPPVLERLETFIYL
jgi:hypothetical protein